jgi:hypothetical protein
MKLTIVVALVFFLLSGCGCNNDFRAEKCKYETNEYNRILASIEECNATQSCSVTFDILKTKQDQKSTMDFYCSRAKQR